MKRTLYIFRHGQTDWNLQKRWQGHSDVPLNEQGLEQAKRLGKFLSQKKLDIIYTSDLERAVQTAQEVNAYHHVPLVKDAHLREAKLGEMEGLHLHEVEKRFGLDALDRWKSNDEAELDFTFPGGESKRAMVLRVRNFIDTVIKDKGYKYIAFSTHGGVIHKLLANLLNMYDHTYSVTNCSLFIFEYEEDQFQLIEYNDFSI